MKEKTIHQLITKLENSNQIRSVCKFLTNQLKESPVKMGIIERICFSRSGSDYRILVIFYRSIYIQFLDRFIISNNNDRFIRILEQAVFEFCT